MKEVLSEVQFCSDVWDAIIVKSQEEMTSLHKCATSSLYFSNVFTFGSFCTIQIQSTKENDYQTVFSKC